VCLESVKGARCIQLLCAHVFCRGCLEDFWKLCISEGEIDRVGCPNTECVKAGLEATEEEVQMVVTDEELSRWSWLRKKRELDQGARSVLRPLLLTIVESRFQIRPSLSARF
jgi:E3 ubiquitin-protein ligase RNF14